MCSGSFRLGALVVLVVYSLTATVLSASDYDEGDGYTGVKVGLTGSGEVDIRGEVADHSSSLTAGFFFDLPLGSSFHYGLSADIIGMNWQAADGFRDFEESGYLLDLAINFKGNLLGDDSPLLVRPGLGIGFGFLPKMETASLAGSNYLTLKLFTEVAFITSSDLILLIDGGVWYAPSGGDKQTDVTIGPLVILRGGVMF